MQQEYVERVVDLTEPEANQLYDVSVEDAREIVLNGSAEAVGSEDQASEGSTSERRRAIRFFSVY